MILISEEDHEVYPTSLFKIEFKLKFLRIKFTVKTRAKSAASCRLPFRFINLKLFEVKKFS
jgi:hypothetical protein